MSAPVCPRSRHPIGERSPESLPLLTATLMHVPVLLDHLVYATPFLDQTIGEIETAFGVVPLPGGTHPAWGTRNAILPLSPTTYLELIGPDPARSVSIRPEIFGLQTLPVPRLVTWAAKGIQLSTLVARARTHGIRLGLPRAGSRQRSDGSILAWELTDPLEVSVSGLIPFFIDWGYSPHPATAAAAIVTLQDFHAEHPDPELVAASVRRLGLDLRVVRGSRPRLLATFRTPRGLVTLQ